MTLYLKYRPTTFDELDLESVRSTLKSIIKAGDIPHAFLFSGPKGLGKTSAARILARVVNCDHPTAEGEPCNKCKQCKAVIDGSHMDVIELDAASNRGIDDIRALREAVKLSPAMGAKKIYIIDEAHMLTLEASNALLKTLEEPPSHVIFILATTNPEKLIDTIRSRATNILFKKPSKEEILRSLGRVVKGEKLKLEESELEKITQNSGGSFRDAVKILETSLLGESGFKGLSGSENVENIISHLINRDVKASLLEVQNVIDNGQSVEVFIKQMLERLREGLLASVGSGDKSLETDKGTLVALIQLVGEAAARMSSSPVEHLPLEVAIVQWCTGSSTPIITDLENEKESVIVSPEKAREEKQNFAAGDLDNTIWAKILSVASPRNKSVEALLRSARPINFDGSVLTLGVFYSFHKERLESPPHRQILDEIISEVFGKNIRVICTMTTPPPVAIDMVKKEEGTVLTETGVPSSDTLTVDPSQDIITLAKEIFS